MAAPSPHQVKERLETLRKKLDGEGHYVRANTCSLALDLIEEMDRKLSKPETQP